ncbi:histone deacetylase HDT1-like isoform X2 [Primulina huaijiensis]|uniref:histone deacetylase HDT1-like isoform X2 n=1 Tax=Primulina huaijiensis TaxID=1492673 RepID=UPI003CC725CE
MEFWSSEVKSGETFRVVPGDGMVLHLSQASLGEMKKEKGNESVCLFVNVEGKKLVLGTLFSDKLPQQQFDLVFDNNFELSHNWKSGSVYFFGYKASNPFDEDELPGGESDESESEEDIPNILASNGKSVSKVKPEKPAETGKAVTTKGKASNSGKQKVQIVEPPKGVKPQDDDDDDDDDSDDDEMSEDDDEEAGSEDDGDESDDESDERDEETPKKVEPSKKRAAESKTPVSDKKAKVTPQKSDDKKGGVHVATPYPKQASKTPANKPNQSTPKGAGSSSSHSCKTCNRTFGSDKALESHSKAKHGA